MTEPVAGSWLGIKLLTLVAGFAGGVVTLSFLRDLTKLQGIAAVLAGLGCAVFLAPIPSPYTAGLLHGGDPALGVEWLDKIEAAYGFLFGLTGMTLVPGIIKIAGKFQEDPLFFIRMFKGK